MRTEAGFCYLNELAKRLKIIENNNKKALCDFNINELSQIIKNNNKANETFSNYSKKKNYIINSVQDSSSRINDTITLLSPPDLVETEKNNKKQINVNRIIIANNIQDAFSPKNVKKSSTKSALAFKSSRVEINDMKKKSKISDYTSDNSSSDESHEDPSPNNIYNNYSNSNNKSNKNAKNFTINLISNYSPGSKYQTNVLSNKFNKINSSEEEKFQNASSSINDRNENENKYIISLSNAEFKKDKQIDDGVSSNKKSPKNKKTINNNTLKNSNLSIKNFESFTDANKSLALIKMVNKNFDDYLFKKNNKNNIEMNMEELITDDKTEEDEQAFSKLKTAQNSSRRVSGESLIQQDEMMNRNGKNISNKLIKNNKAKNKGSKATLENEKSGIDKKKKKTKNTKKGEKILFKNSENLINLDSDEEENEEDDKKYPNISNSHRDSITRKKYDSPIIKIKKCKTLNTENSESESESNDNSDNGQINKKVDNKNFLTIDYSFKNLSSLKSQVPNQPEFNKKNTLAINENNFNMNPQKNQSFIRDKSLTPMNELAQSSTGSKIFSDIADKTVYKSSKSNNIRFKSTYPATESFEILIQEKEEDLNFKILQKENNYQSFIYNNNNKFANFNNFDTVNKYQSNRIYNSNEIIQSNIRSFNEIENFDDISQFKLQENFSFSTNSSSNNNNSNKNNYYSISNKNRNPNLFNPSSNNHAAKNGFLISLYECDNKNTDESSIEII